MHILLPFLRFSQYRSFKFLVIFTIFVQKLSLSKFSMTLILNNRKLNSPQCFLLEIHENHSFECMFFSHICVFLILDPSDLVCFSLSLLTKPIYQIFRFCPRNSSHHERSSSKFFSMTPLNTCSSSIFVFFSISFLQMSCAFHHIWSQIQFIRINNFDFDQETQLTTSSSRNSSAWLLWMDVFFHFCVFLNFFPSNLLCFSLSLLTNPTYQNK